MPKHLANRGFTTGSKRSTTSLSLRRLGSIDFIHDLLFNREQVHQRVGRLPPFRSCTLREDPPVQDQVVKIEDRVIETVENRAEAQTCFRDTPTTSHLRDPDMALGKTRKTPPKKAPARAKPKARLAAATTKKRSPSAAPKLERAPKTQKRIPKANSGKRVNGRGVNLADAYVISDSEDDDFECPTHASTNSLTLPAWLMKVDSPGSVYNMERSPMPTPTPTRTLRSTNRNIENKISRLKELHAKDVDFFSMQLGAADSKLRQVEDDAKREALKLQRDQDILNYKQLADLKDEIEVEKRRTSDLTWECDHLRREYEAARESLNGEADLIHQREKYGELHKDEQEVNAGLLCVLNEKDKEAVATSAKWASEREQLAQQIEALQREASEMKEEITALRESVASAAKQSLMRSQPCSLALSASDADQRLINSRKTYVIVKKRYDGLFSVASNIATATQAWDYGSLGELGQYLRQLKSTLYENGPGDMSGMSTSQVEKVE